MLLDQHDGTGELAGGNFVVEELRQAFEFRG